MEIQLTKKLSLWLLCHGGRGHHDVMVDNLGMYVLMSNGYGEEMRVYLPQDHELKTKRLDGYLVVEPI